MSTGGCSACSGITGMATSQQAKGRLVPRHPLAWGMVKWGPLPDTRDMWIMWDGPGDGLYLYACDPERAASASSPGRRIQHPAASSVYSTVAAAEKAVMEFVRVGLADG